MSAWSKEVGGHLDQEQIHDLVKYIKSWQKVSNVKASDKAISGSIKLGSFLFKANCSQCHGLYGENQISSKN